MSSVLKKADKLNLSLSLSLLPDRSTILAKFMYDKVGKLAGPTQILPVRVRGPALILKTDMDLLVLRNVF